ncbi:type II secretion system protein [Deinococcus pimensis]|nr:prepilin-type N-terminal cleavage/methylation domain-containing protein [Deinococcus pimensis]
MNRSRRGLTLLEVLIAIAVLGIVTASTLLVFPSLTAANRRSGDD